MKNIEGLKIYPRFLKGLFFWSRVVTSGEFSLTFLKMIYRNMIRLVYVFIFLPPVLYYTQTVKYANVKSNNLH